MEESFRMAVPDSIPIKHEAGYHTDLLGTYDFGQYMGFAFYLESGQKHLIAVLHLFDFDGEHVGSTGWDSNEGFDVESELESAIAKLPDPVSGDIEVRLFAVELFGRIIGLVNEEPDRVEYTPYGLTFFPPWNGYYDT